jgi:LuxR family maltose regulon positive regulatory protein
MATAAGFIVSRAGEVRLQRAIIQAQSSCRQLEQLAALHIDAENPCQRAIAQYAIVSRSRLLLASGQAPQPALLGELVTEQERRGDRLSAARFVRYGHYPCGIVAKTRCRGCLQPAQQLAAQQHLKRFFLMLARHLQPLLVRVRETDALWPGEEGDLKQKADSA